MQTSTNDQSPLAPTDRREYESPSVTDHGTLIELTAGSKGGKAPDHVLCIEEGAFS